MFPDEKCAKQWCEEAARGRVTPWGQNKPGAKWPQRRQSPHWPGAQVWKVWNKQGAGNGVQQHPKTRWGDEPGSSMEFCQAR